MSVTTCPKCKGKGVYPSETTPDAVNICEKCNGDGSIPYIPEQPIAKGDETHRRVQRAIDTQHDGDMKAILEWLPTHDAAVSEAAVAKFASKVVHKMDLVCKDCPNLKIGVCETCHKHSQLTSDISAVWTELKMAMGRSTSERKVSKRQDK